jgi:hypothetical protein
MLRRAKANIGSSGQIAPIHRSVKVQALLWARLNAT